MGTCTTCGSEEVSLDQLREGLCSSCARDYDRMRLQEAEAEYYKGMREQLLKDGHTPQCADGIIRVIECECVCGADTRGQQEIEFADLAEEMAHKAQMELRSRVISFDDKTVEEEGEYDDNGCNVIDPTTGHRYFQCCSCGEVGDPDDLSHSAGECNFCHDMNKDD